MSKQFQFLDAYSPIFYDDKTYWVISGGRASGKSTNIAAYFVMKLMSEEYFRGVLARYTQRALTNSIYQDLVDLITQWGLTRYIEVKGDQIINKANQNMIITHSMKLQEGTMSARGKGLSRVTHLLIDEATELPSEEEYIKLVDSFRTKDVERRIFLLFNPTSKNHWIFRRFYLPDGSPHPKWYDNHGFIHTTYFDNMENLDPLKIREWELARTQDPEYYDHHIMGKWRSIGEGQIFTNWRFQNFAPDPESEILYGLDFGFHPDPCAIVRVYKRGRILWFEEMLYETGLTVEDLIVEIERLGIPKTATIFADAAQPSSIESIRRAGWFNIEKSYKGPDSVQTGIDRVKSFEVYVSPLSKNLQHEYEMYSYRTGTNKPIDKYNHLMDAIRYTLAGKQEGPKYAVYGKLNRNEMQF